MGQNKNKGKHEVIISYNILPTPKELWNFLNGRQTPKQQKMKSWYEAM